MPTLEQGKLIKDYIVTIKDQYPTLSPLELETICESPSEYVKSLLKHRENIYEIRIKYLGTFKTSMKKLYNHIKRIGTNLHFKRITQEEHDSLISIRQQQIKYLQDAKDNETDKNVVEGEEEVE